MRVEASGYGYDCIEMVTTLTPGASRDAGSVALATPTSPYKGEGEFRYQQS